MLTIDCKKKGIVPSEEVDFSPTKSGLEDEMLDDGKAIVFKGKNCEIFKLLPLQETRNLLRVATSVD